MILQFSILFASAAITVAAPVTTVEQLVAAVEIGCKIELAPGLFALTAPLDLKTGTTLKGAGMGKTIVTHTTDWKANPSTLPDPETNQQKFDKTGYLIRLENKAKNITLSDLSFKGPQVHGAIFGLSNAKVHLHDLQIADFMYSGIRRSSWKQVKIHDCTFVDAGQRWQKGQPGLKGGITGGGIFAIWIADSEIWKNRFLRTKTGPYEHYYGIKGSQGKSLKIHHNTTETNFSIEFPFEGDEDIEIAHNVLHGTVSIPMASAKTATSKRSASPTTSSNASAPRARFYAMMKAPPPTSKTTCSLTSATPPATPTHLSSVRPALENHSSSAAE